MARIRKNDEVIVIAGKDKGRRGRVIKIFPKANRVVVEGANMVKRHQRAGAGSQQSGIIEREAPIHASNVMPLCPKEDKPTRIKKGTNKKGKKVRLSVKGGAELPS